MLSKLSIAIQGTGSHGCFCRRESVQLNCDFLYSPICLSNLGCSNLAYVLPSHMDLRRTVDPFGPFSFLHVRMEWWLPSSLHVNLHPQKSCSFLQFCVFLKFICFIGWNMLSIVRVILVSHNSVIRRLF